MLNGTDPLVGMKIFFFVCAVFFVGGMLYFIIIDRKKYLTCSFCGKNVRKGLSAYCPSCLRKLDFD